MKYTAITETTLHVFITKTQNLIDNGWIPESSHVFLDRTTELGSTLVFFKDFIKYDSKRVEKENKQPGQESN